MLFPSLSWCIDAHCFLPKVVTDQARRRIEKIKSGQKRIDTGIKSIDDEANKSLDERLAEKEKAADDDQPITDAKQIPAHMWRKMPGEKAPQRPSSARPASAKPPARAGRPRPSSAKPGLSVPDPKRSGASPIPTKAGPGDRPSSSASSRPYSPKRRPPSPDKPNVVSEAYQKVKYQQASWDDFSEYVWEKLNDEEGGERPEPQGSDSPDVRAAQEANTTGATTAVSKPKTDKDEVRSDQNVNDGEPSQAEVPSIEEVNNESERADESRITEENTQQLDNMMDQGTESQAPDSVTETDGPNEQKDAIDDENGQSESQEEEKEPESTPQQEETQSAEETDDTQPEAEQAESQGHEPQGGENSEQKDESLTEADSPETVEETTTDDNQQGEEGTMEKTEDDEVFFAPNDSETPTADTDEDPAASVMVIQENSDDKDEDQQAVDDTESAPPNIEVVFDESSQNENVPPSILKEESVDVEANVDSSQSEKKAKHVTFITAENNENENGDPPMEVSEDDKSVGENAENSINTEEDEPTSTFLTADPNEGADDQEPKPDMSADDF